MQLGSLRRGKIRTLSRLEAWQTVTPQIRQNSGTLTLYYYMRQLRFIFAKPCFVQTSGTERRFHLINTLLLILSYDFSWTLQQIGEEQEIAYVNVQPTRILSSAPLHCVQLLSISFSEFDEHNYYYHDITKV